MSGSWGFQARASVVGFLVRNVLAGGHIATRTRGEPPSLAVAPVLGRSGPWAVRLGPTATASLLAIPDLGEGL